jgi:hypothetical protein
MLIQQIDLLTASKAGIHFRRGHPAFAGEAGLSEVLGCLMNRVNDPED